MNNISSFRACNALYSNLSPFTKALVTKKLLLDDDSNTTSVTKQQIIMGQRQSPNLLKNGFFYSSLQCRKIQKMTIGHGNVFIINRKMSSSRYTNLSPKKNVSDLYDVLGVSPNSKESEIKSAFYKLSKKYHPDINKTEEASTKFAEVLSAYEILGNQTKRRLYDRGTMMHPRFGVSPHHRAKPEKDGPRKNPIRPGGVGQRPEGATVHHRAFTDSTGRSGFKFEADFYDLYSSSYGNRMFTKRESEFFMKRHYDDERSRKYRGIFAGFFVFTFLGIVSLSRIFEHRRDRVARHETSNNK